MSLETGAHDSVDEHLAANHAVRIQLNEIDVNIQGQLREGADPEDNVHSLQLTTKNESLIAAIMDAVVTHGLAP